MWWWFYVVGVFFGFFYCFVMFFSPSCELFWFFSPSCGLFSVAMCSESIARLEVLSGERYFSSD